MRPKKINFTLYPQNSKRLSAAQKREASMPFSFAHERDSRHLPSVLIAARQSCVKIVVRHSSFIQAKLAALLEQMRMSRQEIFSFATDVASAAVRKKHALPAMGGG